MTARNDIEARCVAITDTVVPNYRNGKRAYSCISQVARMWQAAYDGAAATLGGGGENTHPAATGSVREALEKVQDFLREPDHAEHFGTDQLIEWINRRPTHIIPKLLAAAPTPDAAARKPWHPSMVPGLTVLFDASDPTTFTLDAEGNIATMGKPIMATDAAASEAGEGWQPIETAVLWEVYVVTDGENVAKAQLAESDYGDQYWSVDPEDCLEWEPTHCIAALTTQGGAEG